MIKTAEKLVKLYGPDFEIQKVMEEMTELENELWKDMNHNNSSRIHILEERIDVELMLHILDTVYDFSAKEKVKMWEYKKEKINKKYL